MASVLGLSWRWCCLCDAALGWRGFPSTLNIRCDTSPFGKRSLGLIIQSVAILNRVNILCFCTQWDIVTHWRMDTKMIVNTVNFKKLEAYESRSSHSSSCRTDDNQWWWRTDDSSIKRYLVRLTMIRIRRHHSLHMDKAFLSSLWLVLKWCMTSI